MFVLRKCSVRIWYLLGQSQFIFSCLCFIAIWFYYRLAVVCRCILLISSSPVLFNVWSLQFFPFLLPPSSVQMIMRRISKLLLLLFATQPTVHQGLITVKFYACLLIESVIKHPQNKINFVWKLSLESTFYFLFMPIFYFFLCYVKGAKSAIKFELKSLSLVSTKVDC